MQQFFCVANDNQNDNLYEPENNDIENKLQQQKQQQQQIEQEKKKSDINTLPVYGGNNNEVTENLKCIIKSIKDASPYINSQYPQCFINKIFDLFKHNDDITIKNEAMTKV